MFLILIKIYIFVFCYSFNWTWCNWNVIQFDWRSRFFVSLQPFVFPISPVQSSTIQWKCFHPTKLSAFHYMVLSIILTFFFVIGISRRTKSSSLSMFLTFFCWPFYPHLLALQNAEPEKTKQKSSYEWRRFCS